MRFLQLSNVYQSILSNVNRSRLYQRKAASNAKHVSVHVSPVYANSVSELVKPLDIVNLSVPVMQVNPLVILFLILFSDCQSVKPVRKLLDKNQKRTHELLVNNKGSREHDFAKHLVLRIF